MKRLTNHPLFQTLFSLKGNAKTLSYLEPLWGIPYNLIAPFATLYMYALGVNDIQIGLILSLSMVVQVAFAFLGGIIADKWGRKNTTIYADLLGWVLACVIWAVSQNFWYLLIAVLVNSFEHINQTAWHCLLIEDTEEKHIVNIYTWVYISGLLAVFFAPISGELIRHHSVVPVMRWLYAIFAVTMLLKCYITYKHTKETARGKLRMAETKDQSVWQMVADYKQLLPQIARDKDTVRLFVMAVLLSVSGMVNSTFLGLYVNLSLGIPESYLAYFPILRAVIMLVFFFGVSRLVDRFGVKRPMLVGLVLYVLSQVFLLIAPKGSIVCVLLYVLMEGIAAALVGPRKESLYALKINPAERARILALLVTFSFVACTPFGYVAGLLSSVDRRLPFALGAVLYAAAIPVLATVSEKSNFNS